MTDLASLGLRIQSEQVDTASARMDEATASAGRLEAAENSLAMAARRADNSTGVMNVAVRQQTAVLNASRGAMGMTAAEGLNLSRQFADIGVTAAMGMNPLMIALQQGPQLLDIFQMAAIRTGQTTAQVARQMAASWAAALWPILPVIAAIGAAAGAMAAAVGLATRDMSRDVGDLREGLGLTKEQIKRLEEQGVSSTLTMGDYFRGLGTTIKEVLRESFGPQLDWVQDRVSSALDGMTTAWAKWVRFVLSAGVGTFNAIRGTWSLLPAVMGDVTVTTANAVIFGLEAMVNGAIGLINGMLEGVRNLAKSNPLLSMFLNVGTLDQVDFAPLENRWAGAAARAAEIVAGSYVDAWRTTGAALDDFMARWRQNAEASGAARNRREAGDPAAARDGADRQMQEAIDILKPARIGLTPLNVRVPPGFRTQLEALIEDLRLIDDLAREAGRGMAEAFGEPGRALGDLLTTMTDYQARMREIEQDRETGRLNAAQAERAAAAAQIQNYGDMASAAKGFFKEGSDGYKVLQAAEQVYRLAQFAMSVQAMLMGNRETAALLTQSAQRAQGFGIEAAANAMRSLPFPLNLAAAAATIAALAAIGIRLAGGGGGSGAGAPSGVYNPAPVNDGSVARAKAPGPWDTPSRPPVSFDLRGAVVTSDLLREMQMKANQSVGVSVQVSREVTKGDRVRGDRFRMSGRPA